jgi:glyoxylase-like metal-dependent hydrolase (beta-lactamase superfamily II)
MVRTGFVAVPALAVALAAFVSAQAPQGQPPAGGAPAQGGGGAPAQPMAAKQVKPNLYMVTGNGGNTTIRVTDEGLILVDTKNLGEKFYEELMAQVRTVSKAPVRYVFVTHVHQDHSGNIGPFVKAGAQVIAHEGLKRNLETGGPKGTGYESAAGKPATPNVTYASTHKVSVGNATAVAYNFGPGHTGGDTLVHFPDLRVVSLGDHFVAAQPNSDYPMGGSVINWAKSLNEILKLDFDTAIPGHGKPATKGELAKYRDSLTALGRRVIEMQAKKASRAEVEQELRTRFGFQDFHIQLALDGMLVELR